MLWLVKSTVRTNLSEIAKKEREISARFALVLLNCKSYSCSVLMINLKCLVKFFFKGIKFVAGGHKQKTF
jgi:hypothetical protein